MNAYTSDRTKAVVSASTACRHIATIFAKCNDTVTMCSTFMALHVQCPGPYRGCNPWCCPYRSHRGLSSRGTPPHKGSDSPWGSLPLCVEDPIFQASVLGCILYSVHPYVAPGGGVTVPCTASRCILNCEPIWSHLYFGLQDQ
jgi:hypothetical protein